MCLLIGIAECGLTEALPENIRTELPTIKELKVELKNLSKMAEHEKWIQLCIGLGKQAMQTGNPPVGALLVKGGKVIGEGIEAGKSKKDITCHAEIEAIRDAIRRGKSVDMQDCTLYTTHEPCIKCSYVIRHHKIATIVIGIEVPVIGGVTSSLPVLKASDISIWPDPPQHVIGILKKECESLNSAYQNILKKAQEDI